MPTQVTWSLLVEDTFLTCFRLAARYLVPAAFLWLPHAVLDPLVFQRSLTRRCGGPRPRTRPGRRLRRDFRLRAAGRRPPPVMLRRVAPGADATSRRRHRDPGRRRGRLRAMRRRRRRTSILPGRRRDVGSLVDRGSRRTAVLPTSGQHFTIVADQLDYLGALHVTELSSLATQGPHGLLQCAYRYNFTAT